MRDCEQNDITCCTQTECTCGLQSVASSSNSDLLDAAFDLYTPPFKFVHGYIFDSNGETVADQGSSDDQQKIIAQIRGWGRISYLDNPEKLQDTVGEIMALALTEYWEKHKGV